MKSPWEILNIEPTSDANEIKRAYASIAHTLNPEVEPDRYREVHDAYREALSLARIAERNNGLSRVSDQQQINTPSEVNPEFDFSEIAEDYLPENNLAETIIEDIISFRESNNLDSKNGLKKLSFAMKEELSISLFYMYLKLADVTDDLTVWQSFFDEPLIQYSLEFGNFRNAILNSVDPDSPHREKISGYVDDYLKKNSKPDPYVENAMNASFRSDKKRKAKVIILLSIAGLLMTVMFVCIMIPVNNGLFTFLGIAAPMIGIIVALFAAIIASGNNNR
jgi:curved DNA-binding protein CbpA